MKLPLCNMLNPNDIIVNVETTQIRLDICERIQIED